MKRIDKTKRLIDGEYQGVAMFTSEFSLLSKAHKTAITPEDAVALATLLRPGVKVSFRGYRGKARLKFNAIVLPAQCGKWASTTGTMIGKLRVGIVIHELAHLLADKPGHGADFISSLDVLLRVSEGLW